MRPPTAWPTGWSRPKGKPRSGPTSSTASSCSILRRGRRNKEMPMTPRQTLKALIAGRAYTMAPGAYDTLTARLVEQAGFEAVYLTGGGYSRANGYPDL